MRNICAVLVNKFNEENIKEELKDIHVCKRKSKKVRSEDICKKNERNRNVIKHDGSKVAM